VGVPVRPGPCFDPDAEVHGYHPGDLRPSQGYANELEKVLRDNQAADAANKVGTLADAITRLLDEALPAQESAGREDAATQRRSPNTATVSLATRADTPTGIGAAFARTKVAQTSIGEQGRAIPVDAQRRAASGVPP
jgi:hypothetical protein